MTSRVSTTNIDNLSSFPSGGPAKPKETLRRGTWTVEEEQYVACLIEEFKQGHLPLKEGMSLRCFLAKMVHCNPKRISKKFEGSNYNGKQLYEQSDKELEPSEALQRRTKLQALEDKFEDSVTALRAAEDSRKTGLEPSLGVDSINLFPSAHHRPLFAGAAAAGLAGPGILNTDSSWLRGALGNAGAGMNLGAATAGLGLSGLNAMSRGFDPALLSGLGVGAAALEPKPLPPSMNAAGSLRDMVRFSNNLSNVGGDATAASDANLFKNNLSDSALAAANLPQGLGGMTNPALAGLGGGLQPSVGFPSLPSGLPSGMGFPGAADPGLAQDLLHQQLSASAPVSHEDNTRRRLMNLLSQPEAPQTKRNSMMMMGAAPDMGALADPSKKRRLY